MSIVWTKTVAADAETILADCDAAGWGDLGRQLAEVLIVFAEKLSTMPHGSWNRVYIEHWLDSGRLILYPHRRGDSRSHRALTVVVSCDFLCREYDALPGPDDGVELWETYHLALQGKRNLALGRATSNTQVVAAMQKLAETNDFTTWNQESDDPESVSPIYFVPWFGKK